MPNNFKEIEESVKSGKLVYLTKDSCDSIVMMSLEHYRTLAQDTEMKLDEADKSAKEIPARHTHEEVFSRVKKRIAE